MAEFWHDSSKCWEWQKAKAGNGYGVISFFKRMQYVHRTAYRIFKGEIPNGMMVCHKCDNPKCFNPDHLFLGTARENVRDMINKNRKKTAGSPGAKNPNARYSDETILAIRRDFESGILPRDMRSTYGISHAQLYRITRYKTRPNLKTGATNE